MFNNFDPFRMLLTIPGIIIALAFHEFAHAYMSDRFGDPTPRSQGRLTISPIPHIDILGLLMLLLVGFGWAKPVQTNPRYYKNPRRDDILVSVAGSAMNLIVAIAFAFLTKIMINYNVSALFSENINIIILSIFYYAIKINIVLCVFNLIPIPPLDGFHILANIIPARNYKVIAILEQYSTLILIVFIATPVASYIISPIISVLYMGIKTIIGL